ncbi:MAG: SoxR reducing system RseC family protein [Desulfatiglandaceae bacterium]
MVTEEGIVEKVLLHKAMVRVEKRSACAHCESRGVCHVGEGNAMVIEVPNDLQAKVDDRVEISVPTSSLVKLSLLVYFFPILGLIVGAFAGNAWASSFHVQPALASIVCGGSAMAITFCVLRWMDRSARYRDKYQPRMTRILFTGWSREPGDSK